MNFSIAVKGLEALEKKCHGSALYGESVKRIVLKVALIGEALAKSRAPRKTANLQRSITSRQDSPTQARYGTNVLYGQYLDAPVRRNPHYLSSGPIGESTRDWMTGTLPLVADQAESVVRDEIRSIESRWAA